MDWHIKGALRRLPMSKVRRKSKDLNSWGEDVQGWLYGAGGYQAIDLTEGHAILSCISSLYYHLIEIFRLARNTRWTSHEMKAMEK